MTGYIEKEGKYLEVTVVGVRDVLNFVSDVAVTGHIYLVSLINSDYKDGRLFEVSGADLFIKPKGGE